MQTTLLGLAVTMIVALVSALVGPVLVDWGQYRPYFEAEASRVIGMPVRITGAIDARLLPAPSLTLHRIETGAAGAKPILRARTLQVEFGLGSLVRGEWRADEMRLDGPEIVLGIDAAGRLDAPKFEIGFEPDRLAIERLAIQDARLTLTNAANGASLVMEHLTFRGEARSLIGPFKGEGVATAAGQLYGYKLAGSRRGEDGGLKLRLSVDGADRPLSFETEGTLFVGESRPRYDGTVTVSRPAGHVLPNGRAVANVPWRASGRVRATSASALIEQVDFQYGPEDQAAKFGGSAEFRFGAQPRLDGVVSSRQIDADRLLTPDATRRPPAALLKALAETLSGVKPPLPITLGIGIDNLTFGGAVLQAVQGDVRSDSDVWNLDSLEFRAPGLTQVRVSGELSGTDGLAFAGPAVVESADPRALVAWLEGRTDATRAISGALSARGDVTLGRERIAVERLRAEFDRRIVAGALAYTFAADQRPARLEATVTAAEFDLDAAIAFAGNAFAGASFERPGDIALALDFGKASYAGMEARRTRAKLKFDADGLLIEEFSIADVNGAAVTASGRIDTSSRAPRGSIAMTVDAQRLDGALRIADRFAPQAARAVQGLAGKTAATRLSAKLDVGTTIGANAKTTAKLVVDGAIGAVRVAISAQGTGDAAAPRAADLVVDGRLDAGDGAALAELIGLDRYAGLDKRSARFTVRAGGALDKALAINGAFAGAGLDATATGTVAFGEDGPRGAVDLAIAAADAKPLRREGGPAVAVDLKTHLVVDADRVTLADLKGSIAGHPLSGRLAVSRARPFKVEGQIDADRIDLPTLIGFGLAVPVLPSSRRTAGWIAEPFAATPLVDIVGRVDFSARRAVLTPSFVAEPLRGTLLLDGGRVKIDGVEGRLANGRLRGQGEVELGAHAVSAEGQMTLDEAELSHLLPKAPQGTPSARISLNVKAAAAGRSPAALIGGLRGEGALTVDGLQAVGLDPAAIAAAIRAADQGVPVDAVRIGDIARSALDRGALTVPWAGGGFTIADGRVSLRELSAPARDADVVFAGNLDLANEALDLRIALIGAAGADAPAGVRPRILVALKGPAAAPRRTIEVAELVSWLTLRSVEREAKRFEAAEREAKRLEQVRMEAIARETKRLEAKRQEEKRLEDKRLEELEAARRARELATGSMPSGPAGTSGEAPVVDRAPSLPPPIDIRPLPADRRARRPMPLGPQIDNPPASAVIPAPDLR